MPDDDDAIVEDRSLELDEAAMRELVERAMQRIVRYLTTLPDQPAGSTALSSAQVAAVRSGLPEHGADLDELLDLVFDRAATVGFNAAGPGYLAYVPGGGLFESAVADLIANSLNRYTGVWAAAPLLVEIETDVIRWLVEMMGYPKSARGLLLSGGSLATLTAIVTARRERLPEEFLGGVVYVSDQTHHSALKSALIAGFPARNVVAIASDDQFRIRVDLLAERIARDRTDGRVPFLVVGSAGTTNTGAIDDMDALADLCARERLWLHVDAAYGGFFRLTETGRRRLRGLERADSIVLDPHKGLFLPFGTGALLVRDGRALKRAHAVTADYMPPLGAADDPRIDFCEHGPELTRPFRGLRVWLPLRLHGLGPFRTNLDEALQLARYASDRLRDVRDIEIVAEPQLSTLAFRLCPDGLSDVAVDELNERLLAGVLARGRVWLNLTLLRGRVVVRIAILSFRTHRDRVDACIDDIIAVAEELRGED